MQVCRQCKRHVDAVGPLSRRGLCRECGYRNQMENLERIRLIAAAVRERWEAREKGTHRLEDVLAELEARWND